MSFSRVQYYMESILSRKLLEILNCPKSINNLTVSGGFLIMTERTTCILFTTTSNTECNIINSIYQKTIFGRISPAFASILSCTCLSALVAPMLMIPMGMPASRAWLINLKAENTKRLDPMTANNRNVGDILSYFLVASHRAVCPPWRPPV